MYFSMNFVSGPSIVLIDMVQPILIGQSLALSGQLHALELQA